MRAKGGNPPYRPYPHRNPSLEGIDFLANKSKHMLKVAGECEMRKTMSLIRIENFKRWLIQTHDSSLV